MVFSLVIAPSLRRFNALQLLDRLSEANHRIELQEIARRRGSPTKNPVVTYRGNINIKTDHARDLPSPWTSPGSGRPDCIIKAQQTHVATLPTPAGVVYLWMGDRWGSRPDGIKGHDFQYWSSPLQFDNDGMIQQLKWENQWRFELPVAR